MITYHSDDTVILRGYTSKPLKLTLRSWLKATDAAVEVTEAAIERGVRTEADATSNELLAKRWLAASFSHAAKLTEAIAGYRARRPLFDIPPDPSKIIRCWCCNTPLSDPVSKLLGIGPVCRDPRKVAVRLQRAEVAA